MQNFNDISVELNNINAIGTCVKGDADLDFLINNFSKVNIFENEYKILLAARDKHILLGVNEIFDYKFIKDTEERYDRYLRNINFSETAIYDVEKYINLFLQSNCKNIKLNLIIKIDNIILNHINYIN